ncbi:MAG: MBL fold metallo-hydrolase [Vicinamibacteraceae bacterium]
MPTLTFHGAARTVTGSKHLLEVDGRRILIDCGQFQGRKDLRLLNWTQFPFDAKALDAVILTHAHLDHSGMLPRLVADGFKGRVYCTPGTLDLCSLVLPDAGRIQEEDAKQANKYGYSKHEQAQPLFTENDAVRALTLLQPIGYEKVFDLGAKLSFDFLPAGHLLGSAYVRMHVGGGTILFGGDLGRFGRPVLPDPHLVDKADVLLLESTYGDRLHPADDDGERLAELIRTTIDRRGKVIVPSFAIGRVEEVLYWVKRLEEEGRIPVVPVYVDSPMAHEALNFYSRRTDELDDEMSRRGRAVRIFATKRFTVTRSAQESKQITASKLPSIVISSSGMATGGRVLHHLTDALPDKRNTVLFVGFQSEGTRGRQLVDGATEVKIHGRSIPVNATVVRLDGMSAHADQGEIVRWLRGFTAAPKTTYLVHGEVASMEALKTAIGTALGWHVEIPQMNETVQVLG